MFAAVQQPEEEHTRKFAGYTSRMAGHMAVLQQVAARSRAEPSVCVCVYASSSIVWPVTRRILLAKIYQSASFVSKRTTLSLPFRNFISARLRHRPTYVESLNFVIFEFSNVPGMLSFFVFFSLLSLSLVQFYSRLKYFRVRELLPASVQALARPHTKSRFELQSTHPGIPSSRSPSR